MIPSLTRDDGGYQGPQERNPGDEITAQNEETRIYHENITIHQSSIFKAVTAMRGPKETLERLKATWTTLGVVSALLMTFSFPAIYNPPIPAELTGRPLGTSFQVCNSTSGITSAAVVILATILLAMTDWMCSPAHIKDFIVFVSPYHESLILLFSGSLGLLCGAVISITWLNATRTVALVLSCVWGFAIIAMISLHTHIFMRNHKLLEHHVDLVSKQKAATFVDKLKRTRSEAADPPVPKFHVSEGSLAKRAQEKWLQRVKPVPESSEVKSQPNLPGAVYE